MKRKAAEEGDEEEEDEEEDEKKRTYSNVAKVHFWELLLWGHDSHMIQKPFCLKRETVVSVVTRCS